MPYSLRYTESAQDELNRLERQVAERILKKLERLAETAMVVPHFPLRGEWVGFYRIRVGDYRAIYRLDHESRLIVVRKIGHRRDIYDK